MRKAYGQNLSLFYCKKYFHSFANVSWGPENQTLKFPFRSSSFFLLCFVLSLSCITCKLFDVCECSTYMYMYETTALQLEMFLFWVRAERELWPVNYDSQMVFKYATWSLPTCTAPCITGFGRFIHNCTWRCTVMLMIWVCLQYRLTQISQQLAVHVNVHSCMCLKVWLSLCFEDRLVLQKTIWCTCICS